MTKTEKFLKLVQENPDLPILPMVDSEIVADDEARWWIGDWGNAEVGEYYMGREHVHFRDDDEENVLCDMEDCDYDRTKDGRDIYTLSDEEWKQLYESLNWVKAIIVYITI